MAEKKKLVFMITHGPENPELATIPFVMAATVLASDVEALLGFQANGVMPALTGVADHVAASGFPPLRDLMNSYIEAGGRMCVCGPCAGSRRITQEKLVQGASIMGAASFIAECASATNVLVY